MRRPPKQPDRHGLRRGPSALAVALGQYKPQHLVSFFWSAISTVATCSLRSNSALRFVSSTLRVPPPSASASDQSSSSRASLHHAHPAARAKSTAASCRPPPAEAWPRALRAYHSPDSRRPPSRSATCRRAEQPTGTLRHRLQASPAHAKPILQRAVTTRNSIRLRHDPRSILRPSALTFPERAVSNHVGTWGSVPISNWCVAYV